MKDMGRVMKAAQASLAGKNADGRTVSETVKAKLGALRKGCANVSQRGLLSVRKPSHRRSMNLLRFLNRELYSSGDSELYLWNNWS